MIPFLNFSLSIIGYQGPPQYLVQTSFEDIQSWWVCLQGVSKGELVVVFRRWGGYPSHIGEGEGVRKTIELGLQD